MERGNVYEQKLVLSHPKLLRPRKNKCWVVWPSHHRLISVSPKIITTSKKKMLSGLALSPDCIFFFSWWRGKENYKMSLLKTEKRLIAYNFTYCFYEQNELLPPFSDCWLFNETSLLLDVIVGWFPQERVLRKRKLAGFQRTRCVMALPYFKNTLKPLIPQLQWDFGWISQFHCNAYDQCPIY